MFDKDGNTMYWFIAYLMKPSRCPEKTISCVVDHHPFKFIAGSKRCQPDIQFTILSFQQITKEEYDLCVSLNIPK